ncbi:TPA: glycosyltransferase [Vibrio parahaemolyticus]|uniref:Glycosyltransferase family A protein n=2 Tax=Vibrio parahaemolyticus TaxID=670 RepID=A0A7M1W176_VIBPH|nr:glycosyltransferase family A protein [Vibrio parahaemolyticus]EHE7895076.1 glycosyltransferase family 2 protein [Vibrio parahaemolyticus]MBE4072992.1 glycosyltransferase family 2 protein [Vibrio parahaemolyticus]MBE4234422.1 glycosyltransferase family 2 protein [Vibrio parahaemolyticus]MBE4270220.1 glycosyltransferase family 2 protein [Vibrio parahaemolyticus]MBE4274304.1 glycosyltransferase family 2 protein [Vibrio parahaemolyticus]
MYLTIAVSTVEKNLDRSLEIFDEDFIKNRDLDLLIICQGDFLENSFEVVDGINVYYQSERGLSKSRNLAIEKSKGKYIWFLDDDVFISKEFVFKFISEKKYEQDLIFGRIKCSNAELMYKKYSRKRLKRHDMLKVSSIEIIANKDFIIKRNVKFDVNLGLGATFPSGEENVFLLDCYNHSPVITDLIDVIVYHPCFENKRTPKKLWALKGYPESKKIIATKLGGPFGVAYLLKTTFKALKNDVSFKCLKRMLMHRVR